MTLLIFNHPYPTWSGRSLLSITLTVKKYYRKNQAKVKKGSNQV